jgi:hypothetical protein
VGIFVGLFEGGVKVIEGLDVILLHELMNNARKTITLCSEGFLMVYYVIARVEIKRPTVCVDIGWGGRGLCLRAEKTRSVPHAKCPSVQCVSSWSPCRTLCWALDELKTRLVRAVNIINYANPEIFLMI